MALNILIEACCSIKNKTFGYIAPTYSQAKSIAVIDPMMLKRYIPELVKAKPFNESDLRQEFITGSVLEIKGADNPDSIRGVGWQGVVLEEWATMRHGRQIWEEILEPILRENGGWAIFIYTPKGKNFAYEYFERAKIDETGDWMCSQLRASQSGLIDANELIKARESMPERLYAQEFECFPKGTDILTINGIKDISEIIVGDFVLTHSNRYKKVKKIFRRGYEDDLIKIVNYGNNKPLLATPEHPIRVCNDGKNYKWVKFSDLSKNDRITFPKPLLGKYKIIEKEVCILIAWFIAEGSFSNKNLQFSLSDKEELYKQEIISCLNTIVNKKVHVHSKNGATILTISDCELGEFFIKVCGSGAKNKRIPFELIRGYEKEVYEILINGDGCRRAKKDIYTTISKTLAYQVQILAHSLSYPSSIISRKPHIGNIQGRKVNCSESYCVNIYKTQAINGLKLRNHKYCISSSINNISKEYFNGEVFNLEVENDNSYIANGRVVHNCSFLEDATSVFHDVEGCVSGNIEPPQPGHRYVMGVDLGRTNDFSVITVIDIGINKVVGFKRFGDCPWSLQKEHIVTMAKQYNNAHIEIDASGFSAGSVIAEDLMTHPIVEDLKICQLSVSPFKFTNQSKRALVEKLIVTIEQKLITFPRIDELVDELKAFTYEMSDFGNIRYTAPEGLHDDCVMSLGLAVWALGSYIYAPIRKDRFIKKAIVNRKSIRSM